MLAVHGLELGEAAREVLTARTEGWVAGLRLSMVRMEASGEPERFVNAFAMDRGSVGEYLLEEVLAALDAPARRLLIRTSPCDLVSGPLADAICEDGGGTATLERLAETNSFVTPCRTARAGSATTRSCGRSSSTSSRASPSKSRRVLDARAARWHDDAGNLIEALHHAVRPGRGRTRPTCWPGAPSPSLFLAEGERAVAHLGTFVGAAGGDTGPRGARLALGRGTGRCRHRHGRPACRPETLETLSDDPDPWGGGSDAKVLLAGLSYAVLADYARLLVATRDGQRPPPRLSPNASSPPTATARSASSP